MGEGKSVFQSIGDAVLMSALDEGYNQGLWTAEMVQNAVTKGIITQEQAYEILRN